MLKLCPGTVVRISSTRNTFPRCYHQKATIKSAKGKFYTVTYKLKVLDGKEVNGTFYHQELIRARDCGVYTAKIINKIQWLG